MLIDALMWIASGVLITLGFGLLMRDRRGRNLVLVARRPIEHQPDPLRFADVKINVGDVPAVAGTPALPPIANAEPPSVLAALGSSIDRIRSDTPAEAASAARSPVLQTAWTGAAATLDTAAATVNLVLAAADAAVGPAGETGWSPRTGGFGCFRRVLIGGTSIAWLRTEILPTGRVVAAVRAHRDDIATLNASVELDAALLTAARAADMLAEALRPTAEQAARQQRARAEASHTDDQFPRRVVA